MLSAREWILLLTVAKPPQLHETEPVWLPDYAVVEGGRRTRVGAAGAAALALALAKGFPVKPRWNARNTKPTNPLRGRPGRPPRP